MHLRRHFILLLLVSSSACTHPSGFRSPRTLPAGGFEHSLGLIRASHDVESTDEEIIHDPLVLPGAKGVMPTYALRIGATDALQLGGHLGLGHLRFELTYGLLESRFFDFALGADLGFGFSPLLPKNHHDEESLYPFGSSAAVPVLVGIKPFPWLSFVGQGAPLWWGGVAAIQYGGGIDLLLAPWLSLRPHFSVLQALQPRSLHPAIGHPTTQGGLELAFRH